LPSSRDGDLQGTTTNDGGGDEVACVRRIDDVHPDMMFLCSLVHSHIHFRLIGGADDKRTIYNITNTKWPRLVPNDALHCEVC
jgi:hypothetical protein